MKQYGIFILHLSDLKLQNDATSTANFIHYWIGYFGKTNNKRWNYTGSNIWMRKGV